jgi:multiple sugar transport system substrate-binding protein
MLAGFISNFRMTGKLTSAIDRQFTRLGKIFRCLLPLTICLAGCRATERQHPTIVKMSGWQSSPTEQRQLAKVLQEFEREYPQIKVKYEVIPDRYMDIIKTRLIGDAAPDVFYLDALEAPLLIKNNVLEPLDRYITSDFDLDDFKPALLDAFRYRDRLYGLPKDFSTLALFYNKKYFRQAGLTAPPTTWNELLTSSQKLTVDRNGDGRIDRYGLGISPELARQYFILTAFGGKSVDRGGCASFATPASERGLQPIIDGALNAKSIAQPSTVGASSGTEMFAQGKAAMVIEGPWTIPFIKDNFPQLDYATAEVPTIDGKKGTMIYTVAYVMSNQSKSKQAAWKLIAYLTSKKGMKSWSQGGLVLPSRRSVLTELNYQRQPLYAALVAGADYGRVWQTDERLPIVNTNFNNQFVSALLGERSLRSALQAAQATANREIEASTGLPCEHLGEK